MFNGCYFTFAGVSSRDILASDGIELVLCDVDGKGQSDVPFGNRAAVVETRTNRRVQPLQFGVNYNKSPLQFSLIFSALGAPESGLARAQMERVAWWLTGHQRYQWLEIEQPDMESVHFRCLITQLAPISVGWLPQAFEATVTCDCPYAYGDEVERGGMVVSEGHVFSFGFDIQGTAREYILPEIWYEAAGTSDLEISVQPSVLPQPSPSAIRWDRQAEPLRITDVPEGASVYISSASGVLSETALGLNLYNRFNFSFPKLYPGDTDVRVRGNGTLRIRYRPYRNVAG